MEQIIGKPLNQSKLDKMKFIVVDNPPKIQTIGIQWQANSIKSNPTKHRCLIFLYDDYLVSFWPLMVAWNSIYL